MPVNELSFDPRHAWYPIPGFDGAQWSVEVFTVNDVRLIDPDQARFDGTVLQADGLMLPGGQIGPHHAGQRGLSARAHQSVSLKAGTVEPCAGRVNESDVRGREDLDAPLRSLDSGDRVPGVPWIEAQLIDRHRRLPHIPS